MGNRGLALTAFITDAAINLRCSSDPAASVFPLRVYSDEQVQSAEPVTRDVAVPAQSAAAVTRGAVAVQSAAAALDAGSRLAAAMKVALDSRHADDQLARPAAPD
jgi:hypothetical protein